MDRKINVFPLAISWFVIVYYDFSSIDQINPSSRDSSPSPIASVMAFTTNTRCCTFTISSVFISSKANRTFPSQARISFKSLKVRASTSVGYSNVSVLDKQPSEVKSSSWQWKFKEHSVNIHYEEHKREDQQAEKNVLMIPTISDVSTVEEWRAVAKDLIGRDGASNWSATIIDWPGLGYSDKPKLEYNADVMEKFLVDMVKSSDSPISTSEKDLVIVGGGHAATILVRAAKKGLLKPSAIAAVAPTWAGPLPIVFGRDSNMETRYGLLRGTLRAPAVGWMMYNVLVSNEKAIESQYKSHVYSDPTNVTPEIIQSRYNLTKTKGARYVPAAFLTGLLDPVASREEFLEAFAAMEETKIPLMVISTSGAPKRSKAEMEALRGAKGVYKFVEVPGALLPQEEYPTAVSDELFGFLQEIGF